ncbi:hypothetical protein SEA_SWITZERLAND_96 [Gordonia phage Switzerland]|uniref:hypothetical protein n=1 Tax=Gordonia phage JSwag TaxID=1887649 RepID=UPI00084F7EDA|nr:hypothetical protein BIZ70_gp014 [Gordonia phage JSwag]ASZ73972.1 hypothetical protein SEA_SHAYRA_96 [Gordonia phage ShayRa]AXH47893.1 hypothetical protein SEA_LASTRESORT_96 [Gordonia phage LastResort]QDM56272.1 hypothetical protein SEA_REMO_96 [Gordonia phage ReMo]QLF84968.1 hypothetical protein SEA_EPSOCAMISIO_96 [Gordonia phage Epsocamisio]QZD98743.1 hypothetical protein SEA_LOOPER_95 [Gordonia phage Looper]UAJ15586.1 hypothetical protein SEA_BOOHOO_97 [Gordonia Phage Boohoo]UOK18148.1
MNSDQFKLSIRTDNDAFADGNRNAEIARTLRKAADEIEWYGAGLGGEYTIFDQNGNRVGAYRLDL